MEQTSNSDTRIVEVRDADTLNMIIRSLIINHELDKADSICEKTFFEAGPRNKETFIFYVLFLIRKSELENGEPQTFDLSDDPDVLINHYHTLKFLIRRQEFPQMEPFQNELYAYCRELNLSHVSLATIANFSTLHPEEITKKILKGLIAYEQQ